VLVEPSPVVPAEASIPTGNFLLDWAIGLPAGQRRALAGCLLAHPAAMPATLLAAYARSAGLTIAELSGLLPGMLPLASAAVRRLMGERGQQQHSTMPSVVVPPPHM